MATGLKLVIQLNIVFFLYGGLNWRAVDGRCFIFFCSKVFNLFRFATKMAHGPNETSNGNFKSQCGRHWILSFGHISCSVRLLCPSSIISVLTIAQFVAQYFTLKILSTVELSL